MLNPARILCLSALVATFALAETHPAAAAPPPPAPLSASLTGGAKADYESAKILYGARDFAGAAIKFSSAYEQSRDPRLLYNMAACEKNLKHYARAIDLLGRYEAEGRGVLTPADVEEADRLLDTFRAFVGAVRVTATERGATVSVDDQDVGATPLEKNLALDLGEHRVRVEKRGFVPFETRLTVSGPQLIGVDAALAREVHEGVVTIHARAGDAIALDGKLVARGDWTAHVASGAHALTVTAEGMRTFQSDVLVEDDRTRVIDVALDPLPKRGVPIWLLVTGGVVLATGAVVAAAAVYRSYSPLEQKPTPGTASPGYVETSLHFR